jgi:hypothetical protein
MTIPAIVAGVSLGVDIVRKITGSDSSSGKSSFERVLAEFKKVASQTPVERASEAVLKKHGLTKDDLNKLPKAERDGILREIQDAVKRVVGVDPKTTTTRGFA